MPRNTVTRVTERWTRIACHVLPAFADICRTVITWTTLCRLPHGYTQLRMKVNFLRFACGCGLPTVVAVGCPAPRTRLQYRTAFTVITRRAFGLHTVYTHYAHPVTFGRTGLLRAPVTTFYAHSWLQFTVCYAVGSIPDWFRADCGLPLLRGLFGYTRVTVAGRLTLRLDLPPHRLRTCRILLHGYAVAHGSTFTLVTRVLADLPLYYAVTHALHAVGSDSVPRTHGLRY